MTNVKYSYREGLEKQKSRKWVAIPIVGLFVGAYVLANAYAPAVLSVIEPADATAKKLVDAQPKLSQNRVYVPKLNIDVAVVDIDGNEKAGLEKGAIHRAPQNGDPQNGGNFVLAAHRFNMGLTPMQTKAKSPFYHIDKLQPGDDIYVDYGGKRYAYKVEDRKMVPSTAVEIEERTDSDQLTLYSCNLAGPEKGREAIVAKPIGQIVWSDGKPKLKSL